MNIVNFNKEMEKEITLIKKTKVKPKLLLHACCAPCASGCIERLTSVFDVTVYFYNPNMDSVEEYLKRAEELQRLAEKFNIKCIVSNYNANEFYDKVKGLEDCLEGGNRCKICYKLRLEQTAKYAKEFGYEYFATTLTLSPLKNATLLNQIGKDLEKEYSVYYLVSDFKKKGGYQLSIELSKEYGLYRQNYCGCVYSKNKNPN